ncbi:MAG: O-acetyl-ADP-ribose deacetylase [Jatrophihabitans sp.]
MTRLELVQGDITDQVVDAIVNAANSSLLGGGGVDGAIHRRGGPAVLAACRQLRRTQPYRNGLPAGQAVATTAGELAASWVIHTVGPVYSQAEDRTGLLRSCYAESLRLAGELGARTVAFPLISAGAYLWPVEQAVQLAGQSIEAADYAGTARLVLWTAELAATARRLLGSE